MVDNDKQTPAAQDNIAAIEAELTAIKAVFAALSELKPDGRTRVVEYVLQRLGITRNDSTAPAVAPLGTGLTPSPIETATGDLQRPQDIRSLKEQKQPRSAVEMAALAAYYLAEIAPIAMRKDEIGANDINTFFKQAGFPIPGQPRKTLFDAKTAGYLDSAARGTYRLNPVGHNLIAHGLPATTGDPAVRARKSSRKKSKGRKTARVSKKR